MRLCEFPGGNRQAERRKSQGVPLAARLCEFPGLKSLAGSGAAPQAGVWGQGPHDFPKNAVSEQAAKQPTIETGFVCGVWN